MPNSLQRDLPLALLGTDWELPSCTLVPSLGIALQSLTARVLCYLELLLKSLHKGQGGRRCAEVPGQWLICFGLSACPFERPTMMVLSASCTSGFLRGALRARDANPSFSSTSSLLDFCGTKDDLGGLGLPLGVRAWSCTAWPAFLCASYLACQF